MSPLDFISRLPSKLGALTQPQKKHFIHRDVSWLQFNERVLEEARSLTNPLLERVKFLAITSGNLDEFFMIRVASAERQIGIAKRRFEMAEFSRLEEIQKHLLDAVRTFSDRQIETLETIVGELYPLGIRVHTSLKRGEPAYAIAREIFEKDVLPKLPPVETFSIEQLRLLENLQTGVLLPKELWLRIPRSIPTMFHQVSDDKKRIDFFFLDELLRAFLGPLHIEVWPTGIIRLTRDGDYALDLGDSDPESIPDIIRTRIGTRERGKPIRVQYRGELPREFVKNASRTLKLDENNFFEVKSTLYLHGLWNVVNHTPEEHFKAKDIKYPPLQTVIPEPFDGKSDLFGKLQQRDYLLHHPYDSFDAFVELMRQSALDPNVIQIEQTIYRMDALSPVINILKEAAKTKRVRVLIELRARFDELNNLRLTDELEKAGVEVGFGFGKLKLHAKVALITRKENGTEKLYTHLSTGNYNAATARQYTDLAIITANPEIGADARHFFDSLFKGQIPTSFKQLLIAPTRLSRRLRSDIQAEADAARSGKKARIVAKMNALVDEGIIESLYQASQAGVQVDLIVRGACSLIPGVKGLSENIRVVSIVDRFLEHSRIYYFEHSKKMFLSSADWMPRNFFSRLEIAFPVLDPRLYRYLKNVVLPAYLTDTAKARELTSRKSWINRSDLAPHTTQRIRSQVFFRELAIRNYKGTPLE